MKLSDVLSNHFIERDMSKLGVDVKPEPANGKFAVIVGNQKVDIEMDIKDYIDRQKTLAIKQLGYQDAYIIPKETLSKFYAELVGQMQNLQYQGNNIISKQSISSTGTGKEARTIEAPSIQDVLVIDNSLEFILTDSPTGLQLKLTAARIDLNNKIAKLLRDRKLLEAVEILNSSEFWSAKKGAL